jgi:hypothetical protein
LLFAVKSHASTSNKAKVNVHSQALVFTFTLTLMEGKLVCLLTQLLIDEQSLLSTRNGTTKTEKKTKSRWGTRDVAGKIG